MAESSANGSRPPVMHLLAEAGYNTGGWRPGLAAIINSIQPSAISSANGGWLAIRLDSIWPLSGYLWLAAG